MSRKILRSLCLGLVAGVMLGFGAAAAQAPTAPVIPARSALAAAPQVKIGNKALAATVLLPDPDKGFYRGTRFDWAGMIASLTYKGHEYYGLWFDGIAPDVRDYAFRGDQIVASPNTAAVGPTDAYDPTQPLGWADAAPGGTFVKIGVGVLRKPTDGANYSSFRAYELVDHGTWTVKAKADRVTFTQTVSDPASGYGYVYSKTLRLIAGHPALEIGHSLKNIGAKPISTTTFNHNFLTLGGAPTQAGLKVGATFDLQPGRPLRDVATVEGTVLTYQRALGDQEVFSTPLAVSTPPSSAYDLFVRNAQGVGFSVRADRPLSSLQLWSIRSIVAFEPFLTLTAEPNQTVTWTFSYLYSAQH